MAFSIPDYMFANIHEITPEFISSLGIKCILCDIDNTLVTYDDKEPNEAVLLWLSSMKNQGITVIFLSNNNEDRVTEFNKNLGLSAYPNAGKPLTKKAKKAILEAGFNKDEVAVLGDQIFTDVWTGNFLGAKITIVVPPIKDKTSLFFKSKRFLEKPFVAAYKRRAKKTKNSEEI